jgi:putative oxidoreductase
LDLSPPRPVPVPFGCMRRLFSSFASGAPGIGLLLLRLATGGTLIYQHVTALAQGAPFAAAAFQALMILLGVLLLVGLWTPVAAALVALGAVSEAISHPAARSEFAAIAITATALTLLGPGACSVDARLYGWKEIKISLRRKSQDSPD